VENFNKKLHALVAAGQPLPGGLGACLRRHCQLFATPPMPYRIVAQVV